MQISYYGIKKLPRLEPEQRSDIPKRYNALSKHIVSFSPVYRKYSGHFYALKEVFLCQERIDTNPGKTEGF